MSNQKGELTWSHSILIAGIVIRSSEWSEFIYSARRIQPKELSSTDSVPRTKISPFRNHLARVAGGIVLPGLKKSETAVYGYNPALS